MPEGDTIYQVAAVLRGQLVGRRLERVELNLRPAPSLERQVISVEPLGKHLLIALEGGEVIRSHLGMHGSWHSYRRPPQQDAAAIRESVPSSGRLGAERWRRPRRQASLMMATAEREFVCFNAGAVELLDGRRLLAHPMLGRLGPDLMADAPDLDRIPGRARYWLAPHAPLADLLLDQRVACGLGNVYKSEVLFLHRLHPSTRLEALDDRAICDLFATGRDLLLLNCERGPRNTLGGTKRPWAPGLRWHEPHLWVYGRTRQPCRRCEQPILCRRLGRGRRSTYWCPTCQASDFAPRGHARRREAR